MLTFQIKKPTPIPQNFGSRLQRFIGGRWLTGDEPDAPPPSWPATSPLALPPVSRTPVQTVTRPTWDKIIYSRWIESIKAEFIKGQYLALSSVPAKTGELPYLYILEDITEIHHMAPIDEDQGIFQPKCLVVKCPKFGRHEKDKAEEFVIIHMAPKRVRHLTLEESHLVNLRNQQAKENGQNIILGTE